MADEPVPSLEFHEHHLVGMDLVGTVALPSPYPASAAVFVVRYPGTAAAPAPGGKGPGAGVKKPEAKPRFYVKLVESFNNNHVITRLVRPEDIRAIEWILKKSAPGGQAGTLHPGDELRAEIAAIDWSKSVKDPRSSYEVALHPEYTAVVHVAESAPVLLRHEQTLPAAVSKAASPALAAAACPHAH